MRCMLCRSHLEASTILTADFALSSFPFRIPTKSSLLFEEWRDYDSLKAHWAAPHLATFREARQELDDVVFDITVWEATPREE